MAKYVPEHIPLTEAGVVAIALQPPQLAAFLTSSLAATDDLLHRADQLPRQPSRTPQRRWKTPFSVRILPIRATAT